MTYEYTVRRSKRKTLALEITPDAALLVRAPLRVTTRDIEQMIQRHENWIQLHIEAQRERCASKPPLTAEEEEQLRRDAKAFIPGRVAHFSAVMGLTPTGITITSAEKRFGSCSPKNRLSFTWRLMRYPAAAIDYVVVHELAHIRHKNHGRDFYALIESVLPDFKSRKKLLRI